MNPVSISEQQHHILYDADAVAQIVPQWFASEYWQDKANVESATRGRGRAWFINTEQQAMVLRHYQRGGWMARLLGDKYIWQGLAQTRAWREWRLLAAMLQQDLPVPQPLAAHVVRTGLFYRADLLTARIDNAKSLSDILLTQSLDTALWQQIGSVIRRFHRAGIWHADLNAHNILLQSLQRVYLIDFDKGKQLPITHDGFAWQAANLQRLRRSFVKLKSENPSFAFSDADWQMLLAGYESN